MATKTHKKRVRSGLNESNRYKRKNPGNSVFPGLSGTFLYRPIPMHASYWASLGDCKQSLSLVGHSSDLLKLALGELRRTTGGLQTVLFWNEAVFRCNSITIFDRIFILAAVCYSPRPVLFHAEGRPFSCHTEPAEAAFTCG